MLDHANVDELETDLISHYARQGMVSTAAPHVTAFEGVCAEYLGVDDVIATNCGTSALHLAMLMAGIGPGDEVILPVTTFIATANAVRYVGAVPIFVDVNEKTWLMDLKQAAQAITGRTKAILPVHLYGVPCDMSALKWLAHETKLMLIEDAAQSFGATFQGQMTGTFGDYGCYSFNGNKTLTTGGGGLLYCKRGIDKARLLAGQGKDKSGEFVTVGYNYRMTGISAALGLGQMARRNQLLDRKRAIHEIYVAELSDIVTFQQAPKDTNPTWWYSAGLFDREAEGLQQALTARGIPTRRIFKPLTQYRPYISIKQYPVAERLYKYGLCLPSSTLCDMKDIDMVCQIVREVVNAG